MVCKRKCGGASELRNRIDIESITRTPDGSGGFTETWANFSTVWAKITPKKSSERWQGNQTAEITTHEIIIRKLTGIKSEMRISYDGRIFQIKGHIDEDEMKRFNIINAKEGVGE